MLEGRDYLHVAVGVVKGRDNHVLISQRAKGVHQGGLWEFPGGKVEQGETVQQALKRELKEELGISVLALSPLIKIKHHYPDLKVLLDVWTVTHFLDEPRGCEGQEIKWVGSEQLMNYTFPAANYPIINAVRLPSEYAILVDAEVDVLLSRLEIILARGGRLIQARLKKMVLSDVVRFCELAMQMCDEKKAWLLINSDVENANSIFTHGLHLTSKKLAKLSEKPEGHEWISASCHNLKELRQAEKLNLDFIVLAPVMATQTHPDKSSLGWGEFERLTSQVSIPVFALGGMTMEDNERAKKFGGQGISGISAFLSLNT